MGKQIFRKLLLPMLLMSSVTPVTSLTSCGFKEISFKFDNEIVYLPLNMTEDLTQFMTIDSSILAREILWSSSDTDSIRITSTGLAKGVRATTQGQSVVITATLYGNSISCRAIVGEFSFNTNMIVLRESETSANIYESYLKSNSANISRYTTLYVDDENVAKVDENGNIIPVAEGLTKINAKSRGGTVISTSLCVERDILNRFTLTSTTDEKSYIISAFTGLDESDNGSKTVVLPKYKEGKEIKYLGECFTNNSVIEKVVVPDTYTKIVSTTFINNCDNISELILPDTIEDIQDYIFTGSDKLDELVRSDKNTRRGARYLKSNYPEGRSEAPKNSYLVGIDFNSLETVLAIDKDCKAVAHRAFNADVLTSEDSNWRDKFERVTDVTFYDGLTCISEEAFSGNDKFRTLKFPDSVKYIHNSFKNIGTVVDFSVPDSLEYIGTHWLDGTTLDTSTLPCFTVVQDLIYLGSTANKYLILYGLKEKSGSVLENATPNYTVSLEPSCRIIAPNAFQINAPNEPTWLDGRSNGLTRINPTSNQADKTNRLFTGTVSAEETSITCICGNAFKDCDYIDNLVLSAFVKYFDITGIGSSGINRIYCESVNQPMGFDYTAAPDVARARVYYQSVSYKTGNFWHYNDYNVPAQWDQEE